MPIFEYQCEACGERFEKMTSRAKADEVPCAACESPRTRRLLSVFGVGAAPVAKSASPCAGGACSFDGPSPPCAAGGCPAMHN